MPGGGEKRVILKTSPTHNKENFPSKMVHTGKKSGKKRIPERAESLEKTIIGIS